MAGRNRNRMKPRRRVNGDGPEERAVRRSGDFAHVTPFGGEELVADARRGLSPRQMVERRVLVVLGGGSPGRVVQAGGGPSDPRRSPGG